MNAGERLTPVGPRLPTWMSGRTLLVVLLAGHLLLKPALLPRAIDAPLQGDEVAYLDSAGALSNLVRDLVSFGPFDRSELADNVIGNGWFMPGMSLLLTPLLVVDPDPSLGMVRVYLGVLTLLLTAAAAWSVERSLGRAWTLAFLVVPALLPMWSLYSYSAWGDLSAGLVVVILVCRVTTAGRELLAGNLVRLRGSVGVGALCAAALYLRSSTLPLVLGLLALLVLGAVVLARRGSRGRAVSGALAACVAFGLLLAPWSYAASTVLDARVITTSTVPMSTAVAFGDVEQLCFGPCGTGNIWYAGARYSQEVSRATGVSEVVIQRQMSDYALRGATPTSIAEDALGNLDRYALQPGGYEPVFREVPGSPPDTVSGLVTRATSLGYFAGLVLAVGSVLLVARRRAELQLTGLVLKLGLLRALHAAVPARGISPLLAALRPDAGPARRMELVRH